MINADSIRQRSCISDYIVACSRGMENAATKVIWAVKVVNSTHIATLHVLVSPLY